MRKVSPDQTTAGNTAANPNKWLKSAIEAEHKLMDVEGLVRAVQVVKLEAAELNTLRILLDILEEKVAELRVEMFKKVSP